MIKIKTYALSQVRGTVQADILKEDQAQNTCIFSTEFSLKLMGDVQEYFVQHKVRNFYSVSISVVIILQKLVPIQFRN
jgi:methylmalonyl-CoA mutase